MLSAMGINWSDLDVLGDAGVNWGDVDVLSIPGSTGEMWMY